MGNPYYIHDGSASKRLLEYLKIKEQMERDLALYRRDLRYATGKDREELQDKIDKTQVELAQLKTKS